MKIEKNRFVSLAYKLRLNSIDGELVEETFSDNPLEFVCGTGRMIKMFEQKLEGLSAGDSFAFALQPDEAYGDINEQAKIDLPRHLFKDAEEDDSNLLALGNVISMQNAHGDPMDGIVLEVNDDTVKMDFNHPLAGETLFFTGSVVGVREATDDEINGSCGCGGCSGDDCGSDCGSCGCGC